MAVSIHHHPLPALAQEKVWARNQDGSQGVRWEQSESQQGTGKELTGRTITLIIRHRL